MHELKLVKALKQGDQLDESQVKNLIRRFDAPVTNYSTYLTKSELVNQLMENCDKTKTDLKDMPKHMLLEETRRCGLKLTKKVPSYSSIRLSNHIEERYPATWRAADFATGSNLSRWFNDSALFTILTGKHCSIDTIKNHLMMIDYPDKELVRLIQNHHQMVSKFGRVVGMLQDGNTHCTVLVPPSISSRNQRKILHCLSTILGIHTDTLYSHQTMKMVTKGSVQPVSVPYYEKIGVMISKEPIMLSKRKRKRKFHDRYIQRIYREHRQQIIDRTEKSGISKAINDFKDLFYASL